MNKIIYFFIIMILASPLSSQVIHNWGIKGGLLFSGFTTDSDDKVFTDSSHFVNFLSYDIGLYAEMFNSKKFSVSAELHYNTKGERNPNFVSVITVSPSSQGDEYSYKYLSDRFHYISLQILPRYKFIITKEDVLYIFGGPSYDYRISNTNSEHPNSTLEAGKSGGEIAGIIGLGGEFLRIATFEFRFQHNFTPTYTFRYGDKKVGRTSNSIIFQFGVSLKKIFKL